MRGAFIFFLLFHVIIFSCRAQKSVAKFDRFTLDQGLSMNFITCIKQDTPGFIWVGTSNGLNKYDGYKFTVYRNNPGVAGSINNNSIVTLYEDKQGVLYVGTEYGGLNVYDREQDRFITYKNDPHDFSTISANRVTAILEDSKGTLWVGTRNGLNVFDRQTKTFTRYLHQGDNSNSITNNDIRALAEEKNGNLWIGTDKGVSVLKPDRKTFRHYLHQENDPRSISVNQILKIFIDHQDNLWLGTVFGGLNRFEKETESFTHYRQDNSKPDNLLGDFVPGLCEDKEGNLWVATNFGLSMFDRETNNFHNYQSDPFDEASLVDNGLNTICSDRDGNIWIGSIVGLAMKEFLPPKFERIAINLGKPQSLGSKEVFCFYQDPKDQIWIGLRLGFDLYDRRTNTFKHYLYFPDGRQIPTITSIYQDKYGVFWLGMYDGIARYNIEKGIYQIFTYADPTNLSSRKICDVWYMQEDAKGDFYISSLLRSIFRYNRSENRFEQLLWEGKGIDDIDPTSFYIDKQNNFWIGSEQGGLLKINPEKNIYEAFKHDAVNPNSINCNHILTLYEDKKGNFWVGTTEGLNLMNQKTKTFVSYREKDGLPDDQINAIQEDSKGRLWLSTNNGLSNFDPETKTFKNYHVEDGLQHHEFWHRSSYKLRKGEMLFGGLNGFNIINPDEIVFNPIVPPVYITDFQIFNKPVSIAEANSPLQKSIVETRKLTLSYKQSVFSFEFAALNYVVSKKNQYAYRMDGFEKDWNYVGTQRKATYTNLDPGTYTFRVKASNNDGVWNEKGTCLTIIITPPFWQTWWFKMTSGLVSLTSIYLFLRLKTFRMRQENRRLEARVIERTQKIELQKQEIVKSRDELKQLNLEISSQNEILEKKVENRTQDLQAINEKLAASEEALRQTLDRTLDINDRLIESQEQLKEQNQELRKINAELDRFVYSASHDLRAPLSSLLGLINVAKIEPVEEIKTGYFEMMKKSILKLDDFIRSIVCYSRNARQELSVESINIRDIFNETLDNLKYMERSEDIEKNLVVIGETTFYSDPFRLKIIFNNIISNNIRYSKPDVASFIHVRVFVDEQNARIEFEDNGCGIEEDRIDKVFEMFYRASETNVGSGLGLYIVQEVIQALGGIIKINSKLGEGTTFTIQLPNMR